MSESSSYSSLLALVDSHLSRVNAQSKEWVNVESSQLEDAVTTETRTSITQSNSKFGFGAGKRLAIPSFNLSGNQVSNVLAEQVSNMLKAKQSKEELQKQLSEEMKAVHINNDDDYEVIDLMEALKTPFKTAVKCTGSAYSSTESLFKPEFIEFNEKIECENKLSPTLLTCHTDLSYILDFKVPQAKCSTFGKILVSKLSPFSLPYKRKITFSLVQKFDFK